mmetsp:Transcript_51069/g.101126  ORF Transcript_51069/g.101126 Transcript_51069/m.101126 type:complete len:223 (-) Transcript_51069:264-932(-)
MDSSCVSVSASLPDDAGSSLATAYPPVVAIGGGSLPAHASSSSSAMATESVSATDASVAGGGSDEGAENEMISEEMLAVQREAEAELGDVTERIVDKGSSAGGADASTTADQPTGEKVVPNLLRAMSAAGNADLFTAPSKGGDEKGSQLDALLAKASQYSEFIRNSQDTATSSFYQHARKEMGIGDADGGKKKKQKKEAAAAEGTAAAAAAAVGGGGGGGVG